MARFIFLSGDESRDLDCMNRLRRAGAFHPVIPLREIGGSRPALAGRVSFALTVDALRRQSRLRAPRN